MSLVQVIAQSPIWSQSPLTIVANLAVVLSFVLVVGAIVIDFKNYYRQNRKVLSSDRSLVETGSMAAFFVAYYLLIKLRVLEVDVRGPARTVMVVVGLLLVVVGVTFNLWGRVALKSYWANQIKIFEGQRLLTSGPFAVVRHPLYASLIWIFIGGALIYANPLSLVLVCCVFVPMMYVRARKEDALLLSTFGEQYAGYRKSTWMFFPRVWR